MEIGNHLVMRSSSRIGTAESQRCRREYELKHDGKGLVLSG